MLAVRSIVKAKPTPPVKVALQERKIYIEKLDYTGEL